MHRYSRRAVVAFVALLEYLVLAGLFVGAATFVGQSGREDGSRAPYVALLIVWPGIAFVATGFVVALIIMAIQERGPRAPWSDISADSVRAIIQQGTVAAAWGGIWAVFLAPVVLCLGALALSALR
jgi:hypothetical protein